MFGWVGLLHRFGFFDAKGTLLALALAPTVFTMHNTHENDDAIHVCAEGAAAAKPTPLLTPAE